MQSNEPFKVEASPVAHRIPRMMEFDRGGVYRADSLLPRQPRLPICQVFMPDRGLATDH